MMHKSTSVLPVVDDDLQLACWLPGSVFWFRPNVQLQIAKDNIGKLHQQRLPAVALQECNIGSPGAGTLGIAIILPMA